MGNIMLYLLSFVLLMMLAIICYLSIRVLIQMRGEYILASKLSKDDAFWYLINNTQYNMGDIASYIEKFCLGQFLYISSLQMLIILKALRQSSTNGRLNYTQKIINMTKKYHEID